MRKSIVAGNWKMNLNIKDSVRLAKQLKQKSKQVKNKEILIIPSYTSLQEVNKIIRNSNISLGAQNVCYEDNGAFTGEVSSKMLKDTGCKYVLVGHSERRHIFNETDEVINLKVKNILKNKLKVILCVGETLKQKKEKKTYQIIVNQIKNSLKNIKKDDMKNVVIAYEPVWAIGTGKNATAFQAQEIHVLIRHLIKKLFGEKISYNIRILYGGSVKPDNILDLMLQSDIDGVLVGGASLNAKDFIKIIDF